MTDAFAARGTGVVSERVVPGSAEVAATLTVIMSVARHPIFVLQRPSSLLGAIDGVLRVIARLPLLRHSEPRLLAHSVYQNVARTACKRMKEKM
jgi:hypothetical protein